jgi:hypothetical protein
MMRRLTEHDEAEINSILSREDEILPSSGFATSVMDAVRREATTPAPIPFPWKRALPGLMVGAFAIALVLVAGIMAVAQAGKATAPQVSMSSPSVAPLLFHGGGIESAATWTVLALLVAFVSVKLSVRLTSGRV